MLKKRLSAVIPCYRDAECIRPLYERLTRTLRAITDDYEIVYVENGSVDNAADILRELARLDRRLTVITLSRNFDSQNAFTIGMRYATGDAVVLLDGDLQDPPELITAFVDQWVKGHDVVYGVRVKRKGSLLRRIEYKLFYRIFRRLSSIDIPVDAGDFSLMDRRVVDVINRMPERERFLRGLRAWVGFSQAGVPYTREERYAGDSTNSFLDNIRWAKRGIISFSYAPLELISYLAILTVGFAAIALVTYVGLSFTNLPTPRGFPTLIVLILLLGGVQLLAISIIGEYLGKIFEEVKRRPPHVVKTIVNDHRKPSRAASEHDLSDLPYPD